MSDTEKPLSRSELLGPARDFADFCEAEFEQRRNSDAPFDEASYRCRRPAGWWSVREKPFCNSADFISGADQWQGA